MNEIKKNLAGIWSATPTPLTVSLTVDEASVRRMVEHHIYMGIRGLFLAGTCGEGPLLSRRQVDLLVRRSAEAAAERLKISVQVTDNSYCRVLDNIKRAGDNGADIVIVSEPSYEIPLAGAAWREKYYREILDHSMLPVGIYVRQNYLPESVYQDIIDHPNMVMLKDSSMNDKLMHLFVRNPSRAALLTGDEFHLGKYLQAGYDGILSGGCIVSGLILKDILEAARNNDYDTVAELQRESDLLLHTIYGDAKFSGWLTGLKYTLTLMGVFAREDNFGDYPLMNSSREEIKRLVASSQRLIYNEQNQLV